MLYLKLHRVYYYKVYSSKTKSYIIIRHCQSVKNISLAVHEYFSCSTEYGFPIYIQNTLELHYLTIGSINNQFQSNSSKMHIAHTGKCANKTLLVVTQKQTYLLVCGFYRLPSSRTRIFKYISPKFNKPVACTKRQKICGIFASPGKIQSDFQ